MMGLRERLRQDAPFVTVFSIVPREEIVEMIGLAGFDAVLIDCEHGPFSVDSISGLVLAARARGIYSIVRVRENNPTMIGSALDAGADGVLVPQVESRAEAETVVAAARFAPAGSRGAHPWVRAAAFSGDPDWFRRTNEETAVLVMIEGKEGVAAAADIIATPDLDGVFLGPVDLSHALGVPGNIDHPDVIARVTEVVGMAKEQSKTAAVFTPTSEGAKRWLALGANMVAVGTDTAHFMDVLRQLRSEIS